MPPYYNFQGGCKIGDNSYFRQKEGFKVRIKVRGEEVEGSDTEAKGRWPG